jgi:uncharacterized protein YutE (UPF0331/DUF86 family)
MGWKQFIANLVSSLAWPTVIALILFAFRSELMKILQRLAHLKYKDLELQFEKVKQQAEELPEELAREEPALKNPAVTSLEGQIWDAVERAPSAAILLAWSALETAMASAVNRMAISPDPPSYRSPTHNIEMLHKYGALPDRYAHLLSEMRMLRNNVAHPRDSILSITQDQARNYAKIAIDMIQHLEHMQRNG